MSHSDVVDLRTFPDCPRRGRQPDMTSWEMRSLCDSSEDVLGAGLGVDLDAAQGRMSKTAMPVRGPVRRRGRGLRARARASMLVLRSGAMALLGAIALLGASALLPSLGAHAQESNAPSSITLKGSVSYTDQSSTTCEEANPPITGPFAGQNPLTCHAESAPTDSNGQCTLQGMTLLTKQGNTCYYCATPTPLVDGIVIPIDDIEQASQQGYLCGIDEFDQCKAVCGRTNGSGPYEPPSGTVPNGSPIPPLIPGGLNVPGSGPGAGPTIEGAPLQGGVKQPSNPIVDTGQYLQGMMAGLGGCVQGFGSLIAGAGYFAQGDFVHAAQAWGVTPGESMTLKTIYAEMTAPVIGSGSDPYTSGVTAGRRLCAYGLVPGVAKAAGTALKGAVSGPKAPPVLQGQALQDALNKTPKQLANQTVQLTKGTAKLGAYVADGSFAAVFKNGAGKVIKLSKNGPDTMGYGPDSILGQKDGAAILQGIEGVETPEVSGYQAAGPNSPASIIADDVSTPPDSFTLSSARYQKLTPALQGQAVAVVTQASNAIAKGGYVMLDPNPSNFMLQPVGNAYKAIIHDPDMIMTPAQVKALPSGSPQLSILQAALDLGDAPNLLSQGFTAESIMNVINTARIKLLTGITNVPSDTLPPAPAPQ